MKIYRFNLLATIFLLTGAYTLNARGISNWSDKKLLDKSDLVVIATPISTKDTSEVWVREASPIGCAAIGIETIFKVSAVLKGDTTLKEIKLHYYQMGFDFNPVVNGPLLLSIDLSKKHTYLLFLLREADGRYAPTVGQVDPGFSGYYILNK